jgi:chromosome segregation ATPase
MILYVIMGFVVIAALGLVGFLFYLLNREGGAAPVNVKEVPVTDLSEFKKEEIYIAPPMAATSEVEKMFQVEEKEPLQEIQKTRDIEERLQDAPYQARIEELEEELREISEKAVGQSQEALNMIDALNKENEALKIEKEKFLSDHQAAIEHAGEQVSKLREDNTALQGELDGAHSKVRFLEEEVLAVKKQMGEELARVNSIVEELRQKEAEIVPVEDPQLIALREQNQTLLQSNLDFQKSLQKLKELNDHLIQKTDILQYELTKARAQASGLERVSQNYKTQIEGLLKGGARVNRLPQNATSTKI